MFGPTGLDMLTCQNEYFLRTHIYALPSMLTHGSLELSATTRGLLRLPGRETGRRPRTRVHGEW